MYLIFGHETESAKAYITDMTKDIHGQTLRTFLNAGISNAG